MDERDAATLARLQAANAEFCHAINLRDFRAYAKAGRLLSRAELRAAGAMTPFYSDAMDEERGLFGHLFGNFGDFGNAFGFPGGSPNLYGPILLRWRWTAIARADDLAITTVSAGKKGYDREAHAVAPEAVPAMFKPGGRGYPAKEARLYEVSFRGELPLQHATGIVVDPVSLGGRRLFEEVVACAVHLRVSILLRTYAPVDRRALYTDICDHVAGAGGEFHPAGFTPLLQDWWEELTPERRARAALLADYLHEGTLRILGDATAEAEAVE